MANVSYVTVLFECTTDDVVPVFVTGSCAELGRWNPAEAIRLKYNGHQGELRRHHWSVRVDVPSHTHIEFKFFRLMPQWEGGPNRRLDTHLAPVTCADVFRQQA